MKTYEETKFVIAPLVPDHVVDGGEWSFSRLRAHLVGGWMGTRAGLDAFEGRKFLSPAGNLNKFSN
jgi:hypothetical protein